MLYVAVHAAVRRKPHQVKSGVILFYVVYSDFERLVFEKFARFNRVVYERNILIHNSARAEVEMPHLAVAHLTCGKSHGFAARFDLSVRILFHYGVEIGSARLGYGVAALIGTQSEPVHYYYCICFHNYLLSHTGYLSLRGGLCPTWQSHALNTYSVFSFLMIGIASALRASQ